MDTPPASERQHDIEQPGLSRLRKAVANVDWLPHLPRGTALRRDVLAGLNSAIGSAPDGMANSLLAGVNPVYGLYASMIGPPVGALFSSTQLMVILSTSAAALAANQGLTGLAGEARDRALFALVILVGVFSILLGLLRAGTLIRFVSYSVMTGFLTGIAALMVLSQFPTITGVEATVPNKLIQAVDVLANLSAVDLFTLAMAILTLTLLYLLPRTPVGNLAPLAAITVPSVLVALFRWETVQIVQDVGEIPRGFPTPYLPSFSDFTPALIPGALAVAVIIIVQGAGVSQSVPNPDKSRRRISRDILAQGVANLAAGFFRGLPVGGSLSATALSVIAGPRTRWAAIFTGLWLAAIVLLFPGLISFVVMPALGAVLIHAGLNTIKPAEWLEIWESGPSSRLASVSTFLATLILSIEVAVGVGVVLSALLYLNESSNDISLVELVERPDGSFEERKRPRRLKSSRVTVVDIYGPLYYASARTLERKLPSPQGAQNPVVVLRLRGHTKIGATVIEVLDDYAGKLMEVNGQLYLTGMSEAVHDQLMRTGKLNQSSPIHVYEATPVRGQSTHEAIAEARAWLSAKDVAGGESSGEGMPTGEASEEEEQS